MNNKIIGVLICMLLLGVALAPGITATVNLSDDASTRTSENKELNNELVEITVEVGNSEHKVMLTPTQAEELENLIGQTKIRLDAATTMDETSHIFDETVVSLYELGMLPDGMSIEDAQQLVNGHNRFSRISKLLDGLGGSNLGIFNDHTNLLCLIAGETDCTAFYGRPIYVFLLLWYFYFYFIYNSNPMGILYYILLFFYVVVFNVEWYHPLKSIIPVSLGDVIGLGYLGGYGGRGANGWVHTIGLNGINKWDGWLHGLPGAILPYGYGAFCPGVHGFTGIKIHIGNLTEYFYLGTAMLVRIRD